MYPEDLKYSRTHEWVRTADGEMTVGITDYAQDQLGDVVAVDLPPPGKVITAGEEFGTVDSVKAVSELMSPVSGEVVRSNNDLMDAPELINDDPYGRGWMIVVRPSNPAELEGLMNADEYEAFLARGE